jgi:hypothetical protein
MAIDTRSSARGRKLARRSLAPLPPFPDAPAMPTPRNASLGEVALTATLLSIYVGARGAALALGVLRR